MRDLTRVYLVVLLLILVSLACNTGSVPGLEPVASSPTPTPTASLTPTATPSRTPVVAATRILSPTPARSPTPTLTPTFTPQASITPSFTPTDTPGPASIDAPACPPPVGGFNLIYNSDPALREALRCPISHHPRVPPDAWEIQTAFQAYEGGMMIWISKVGWYEQKAIYLLFNDGSYQFYDDTWQEGIDPESGGEAPPEGRIEPMRGFGKVWREHPEVRAAFGWALQPEMGGVGRIQLFEGGTMLYLSQNAQTYIFINGPPPRWQVSATPF